LAALLCGLGLSVTSCKDDDDDNKSEEQQQQEQEQTASKFWSVVGQLVSSDDYTADYADKTFEPVYGTPDATNATTRIVETNDMQTAARYFADLITVDDGSPVAIDENTQSYTFSDPDVGTLTYTRGGTAEDWATVDVNIKQVPRLRKIIYRQGGEGTNTGFAGKAYYRFGDVVSRTVDDETEYWICVRPAFGPESTSSSFWVCMNSLPQKNYEYVNGSNGHSYFVPTGIGTDKKDMQNLAEMLYAICYPQQWYENATNLHTDGKYWGYSGMPIFNDWTKANLMYHNQYFWQKVADAWKSKDIPGKAMNVDFAMLDKMTKPEGDGVNLLYKGYSWWTKTSWSCTLYQASFTHGTKNAEKNLHHAEYKDLKRNMKDINGFSCLKMGAKTDNYAQFFDNDGKIRWVVRFATGEELNGGTKPAPTAQLQGGCRDVYRYYAEYPAEWYTRDAEGKNGPEITASSNNVNNAPADLTGVFQIGDVLECVEDGTKWFCILGKPENTTIPYKDKEATFVSFDIPESGGVKAQGLPSEAELPEYAFRFLQFLFQMNDNKNPRYLLDLYADGQLGSLCEHIKRYAGIDIHDLYVYADSVWNFKDNKKNKDVASESGNVITNMAYDDGSADHQAVARLILDYTQAGSGRTYCDGTTADGKYYKFENWLFYIYKHYEYFDQSRQTPFPTGWNELGATAWQWLWPVSNTQITLQDLTNQALVMRYGAADKWASLPIKTGPTTRTERRTPRTQAETSVKPADFFYKDGRFATAKRSLWNEPVLFMRMAKIVDPGHRQLNLESTDGRHFRVVHMQTEDALYKQNISSTWAISASADRVKSFYIDNVPTPLPEFEIGL
jgi:hypothetical protein